MFGKAVETPQTERTPFHPRSPYAVAKLCGHWFTINYRESYGIHANSGILFNHESPLRGRELVTRKITAGLAQVKHGQLDVLTLGNLEARRDWGFAGDYVEGIWRMLQEDEPSDYVLATGEANSVRHFVELAGAAIGFDIGWQGSGKEESGIDRKSGQTVVRIDPAFYRPAEVDALRGLPQKAAERLGWRSKTSFEDLVTMMAEADERRVRDGKPLQ
jgi:GDPmannose 4,6-dehydratase